WRTAPTGRQLARLTGWPAADTFPKVRPLQTLPCARVGGIPATEAVAVLHVARTRQIHHRRGVLELVAGAVGRPVTRRRLPLLLFLKRLLNDAAPAVVVAADAAQVLAQLLLTLIRVEVRHGR